MTSITDQERMSAPVILSAIAGILMLIFGFVSLTMISYHTMYGGHQMLGMMMRGGFAATMPQVTPWIVAISITSLISGVLVLFSSYRLHTKPQEAKTYGTAILIVSIVGIFTASGFWIGSVLGIVAGIVAISRK